MASSLLTLASMATLFASTTYASFSPSANNQISVYWGQNSYGQSSGSLEQQDLSYYCSNTDLDIIPISFLVDITNPQVNFADSGNACTTFPGTSLLNCPKIASDIAGCQAAGKTILLSIGGATYSEGGFSSTSAATDAANNIWAMFGPQQSGSSVNRPFGSSAVDGFDFDFESTVSNMVTFGTTLRNLMDADKAKTGKNWMLTAAPQCPYPDAADGSMLNGAVYFDAIWVQFYNNYCGANSYVVGSSTQNNFNFATWDNWAKTVSKNPNVKVFLGIPGNVGGAGSGYVSGSTLASLISYSQTFSSFGGVMMWDMSQVWANSGFLSSVASDLGNGGGSGNTVTTTSKAVTTATSTATTLQTVTKTATTTAAGSTGSAVAQWGQCGGIGYTGSTTCASPYKCVVVGSYWSQCE